LLHKAKINKISDVFKILKPAYHGFQTAEPKLADGSTAMCKGCVKLNTIIDGQLLPITFILVPSLNFDILLGMIFINEFEVKIEGDERSVILILI